jgi:phosphomannomutase
MYFIFDVDGTLTPSRGVIDNEFKVWFNNFMDQHPVAFVTGSDLEKTIEQLGEDLVNKARFSFNCSGNAIYQQGKLIYKSDWKCPDDLWLFLENKLYYSRYNFKYGKHFEERIGMLNFSIVGRNAIGIERDEYYQWDRIHLEREHIANEINNKWSTVQAVVGGETGIDIFAKGADKSQILKYLPDEKEVYFFGDRMDKVGNDYPLGKVIIDNNIGGCYNVLNWMDTWQKLKAF